MTESWQGGGGGRDTSDKIQQPPPGRWEKEQLSRQETLAKGYETSGGYDEIMIMKMIMMIIVMMIMMMMMVMVMVMSTEEQTYESK